MKLLISIMALTLSFSALSKGLIFEENPLKTDDVRMIQQNHDLELLLNANKDKIGKNASKHTLMVFLQENEDQGNSLILSDNQRLRNFQIEIEKSVLRCEKSKMFLESDFLFDLEKDEDKEAIDYLISIGEENCLEDDDELASLIKKYSN